MSTVAIYNGFGEYETKGREKGITLTYGGKPFWLPFKKVAYIPDFTFREVDHDKTAAVEGEEGVLTYKTFRVSGQRIAEELLEIQVPVPNKDKGIIRIHDIRNKQTGEFRNVFAGMSDEGVELSEEVAEIEVSEADMQHAAELALAYKRQIIEEYFQSKRERMSGGQGRLKPEGMVKVYMKELGIKDIDALPTQQNGGSELEKMLIKILSGGVQIPAAAAPAVKADEDFSDLA